MTQMTFDLALVEEDDRPAIEAATRRLHELERRTGEAIVEIGRTLIEVKARLGHGHFGQWLDEEFGWTARTARNFMQVADMFGDKTEIISDFAPTALVALASGTVPDSVRDEFIARAESGERVSNKDVQSRLAEIRQSIPSTVTVADPVELVTGEVVDEEVDETYVVESTVATDPPPHRSHSIQVAPTPLRLVDDPPAVVEAVLSEDSEGKARARLRKAFWDAKYAVRRDLVGLNVVALSSVIGPEDRSDVDMFIRDLRGWLDRLDSELHQGIRLVGRKGA